MTAADYILSIGALIAGWYVASGIIAVREYFKRNQRNEKERV